MSTDSYRIEAASWEQHREELRAIRFEVFVDEQNVPPEEEIDAQDTSCFHVIARDTSGRGVGTGRLLPDGHIGRMAVRAAWRGKGVGGAVLQSLIDEAERRGMAELQLSSQTHAIPFYARYGFVAEGPEYMDAGIPHRLMKRTRGGDAS